MSKILNYRDIKCSRHITFSFYSKLINIFLIFTYIILYNSSVSRVFITELLNDWTNFDEILCVYLCRSLDSLHSQLYQIGNA